MIEYTVKVYEDGTKFWYLNGKLHREDGPAIERADGTKSWYLNDKRHREDGPAIEYEDGTKKWFLNGQLHREDGPAVEIEMLSGEIKSTWVTYTLVIDYEAVQEVKDFYVADGRPERIKVSW